MSSIYLVRLIVSWYREWCCRRDFARLCPAAQGLVRAFGCDPDSLKTKGRFLP